MRSDKLSVYMYTIVDADANLKNVHSKKCLHIVHLLSYWNVGITSVDSESFEDFINITQKNNTA